MLTIRRERPDDAAAAALVHVRGWQAGYAGILPDEVLARLDVGTWARRRREVGTSDPDQPFTTLVAEGPAGIVGHVRFGPYRNEQDEDDLDPAYGEILGLYVDPDHWGTGVGGRLLAAAREALAERGWTELRLWVLIDNVRARRFYERAGLAPDGARSVYRIARPGGLAPYVFPEIRYRGPVDAA
ncbi:GNAT family N-acetyltransferase [Polymorphospora lycopeni]|uniref:GNAT family N-acetyltransferase n=1 Tax=Polymorphospora lycopeni TaxID=3140240 RepID=A0ABV5CTP4_9ACTN